MRVSVVGSGVSGCHAALTLLERGYEVDLWDVGTEDAAPPAARVTFHGLKDSLPDAPTYFLGVQAPGTGAAGGA